MALFLLGKEARAKSLVAFDLFVDEIEEQVS